MTLQSTTHTSTVLLDDVCSTALLHLASQKLDATANPFKMQFIRSQTPAIQ